VSTETEHLYPRARNRPGLFMKLCVLRMKRMKFRASAQLIRVAAIAVAMSSEFATNAMGGQRTRTAAGRLGLWTIAPTLVGGRRFRPRMQARALKSQVRKPTKRARSTRAPFRASTLAIRMMTLRPSSRNTGLPRNGGYVPRMAGSSSTEKTRSVTRTLPRTRTTTSLSGFPPLRATTWSPCHVPRRSSLSGERPRIAPLATLTSRTPREPLSLGGA